MTSQIIRIEELPLPAINIEIDAVAQVGLGYLRIVRTSSSITLIRKANVALGALPYFWAADDTWYEPVNIRNIKLVPWWLRLLWLPDDLAKSEFELRRMEEPPLPPDRLFRNVAGSVFLSGPERRTATKELKQSKTCLETIAWYEKYNWDKARY